MPVYNSVNTVNKSIASFKKLSEISNFNCRLFIVDDCSTDQSNMMIDEIIKSDENINFIQNNKNIGPGLSRNKALEKIRSGYVGFLDSDDEEAVPLSVRAASGLLTRLEKSQKDCPPDLLVALKELAS